MHHRTRLGARPPAEKRHAPDGELHRAWPASATRPARSRRRARPFFGLRGRMSGKRSGSPNHRGLCRQRQIRHVNRFSPRQRQGNGRVSVRSRRCIAGQARQTVAARQDHQLLVRAHRDHRHNRRRCAAPAAESRDGRAAPRGDDRQRIGTRPSRPGIDQETPARDSARSATSRPARTAPARWA